MRSSRSLFLFILVRVSKDKLLTTEIEQIQSNNEMAKDPKEFIFQHIKDGDLESALQILKNEKLAKRQKRLVNKYSQELGSLQKRISRLTLTPDEHIRQKHHWAVLIKDLTDEVYPSVDVLEKRKFYRRWLTVAACAAIAGLVSAVLYYYSTRPPESVKVLILPFNPIKNCTIEETSYEQQIINRYETLIKEDSLNLNFEKLSGQCVQTEEDAYALGEAKGVDLVIWGDYNEDCDKDGYELAIKYSIVNKINKLCFLKDFGDTKIQKIESIYDLSNGALQEDVDRVIYSFLITKVLMEDGGPILNILQAANIFRKYLKRYGECQESMMTDFLLCAYGPFSTEIDKSVKHGISKVPFQILIQTEGTVYTMLNDYLKICPNSEAAIKHFTLISVTIFSIKGMTLVNSQNMYLKSKSTLLGIRNESNKSLIDKELSTLNTSFKNLTQPSIIPSNLNPNDTPLQY